MSKLTKAAAASLLAGAMIAGGAGSAFAADTFWSVPTADTSVTNSSGASYVKTYGVRAGSAGGDYVGISNTNFDANGAAGATTAAGSGDDTQLEMTAAHLDKWGAQIAIWATSVNENPNPYLANLMMNTAIDLGRQSGTKSTNAATTWQRNCETSAWGDSYGTPSTDKNGNATIQGLEYSPEIIYGANKMTNWSNFSSEAAAATKIGEYETEQASESGHNFYNPTYANNDSTNVWSHIYSINQLGDIADGVVADSDGKLALRYGDASNAAIDYEKSIRGNLLYVASQLDSGAQDKKTVAYLYAIDENGAAYFFTPEADGLIEDKLDLGGKKGSGDTKENANKDYAGNNGTVDLNYMDTLPFITHTYTGMDTSKYQSADLIMRVEDIYKNNPVIKVTDASDLTAAGVDVVIYNTNVQDLSGITNGRNSSGVVNGAQYKGENNALSRTAIASWLNNSSIQLIAGDDFGCSNRQALYAGTAATAEGEAPLLYCARNYTADKDARAAWAFSKVYPELYGGNEDASYNYWVKNVYHIKTASVSTVSAYMQNKTNVEAYTEAFDNQMESYFKTGYDWWLTEGSVSGSDYAKYAFYNGQSRASYYSGREASAEPVNTIGIFTPSYQWIDQAGSATQKIYADSKYTVKRGKSFKIGARAYGKLSYKSSNKKLVVNAKGKVTAKKALKKGTYKITITAAGNYTAKKATKVIKVVVK